MHTVGIVALAILLYGNPLLLAALWIARVTANRSALPTSRMVMSWFSLVLATVALVALWLPTLSHAYPDPDSVEHLRLGFRISLCSAAAASMTALFSRGWERIGTALCAFVVPLNWLMWAVFQ